MAIRLRFNAILMEVGFAQNFRISVNSVAHSRRWDRSQHGIGMANFLYALWWICLDRNYRNSVHFFQATSFVVSGWSAVRLGPHDLLVLVRP